MWRQFLRPLARAAIMLCCVVFPATAFSAGADARNWPGFRGEFASGVSNGRPTATTWDVPSGKNVKWKTPVAGLAHSSPVVWQDRIFLTTASVAGKDQSLALKVGLYGDINPVEDEGPFQWKVLCFDRATGKPLWEQTAHQGVPKVKRHPKSSQANCTPATDGTHLVAFFGSEGLYCYDLDGKLLWSKDLGTLDSGYHAVPQAQWGFASSPVIHDGKVVVQCDVQKGSFLAVFDVSDGKQVWRVERHDYPTWSTPTVFTADGQTQVVCNGFNEMAGYDFATGKRVWRLRGGGDIPVPTPVVAHDLIFLASAHGFDSPTFAVRTGAKGEITPKKGEASTESIAWWRPRGANYMQTPIVVGDLLYCCRDTGVLTVCDARTGKVHYTQRVEGGVGFTASAVAAGDKLYFTSEDGQVHVIKAGPTFERLAQNTLGENCMATPAISDGLLLFRTQGHLIAVAENEAGAAR